jgi:hypothetical protein
MPEIDKQIAAAIAKLQQEATLTDDEVMDILSILNPENKKLERIIYATFCAIQSGEDDIETLYKHCDHWMDHERS